MNNPLNNLKRPNMNTRVLKLNGDSAIQSCICRESKDGVMYLKEPTLLFIVHGTLTFRYGREAYEVGKEQMVFFKKDILIHYSTRSTETDKVEYILVSLKNDIVKEFVKLAELPMATTEEALSVSVNSIDRQLLKYIDSLQHYFTEPQRVEGSLIKIKLLELLFYLIRHESNVMEQILDIREHYRCNITATVEENILNSLSLHQLAVLAGRSLSSFRRDFLATYNMPPSQWIRERRLEKARELLERTTMTVTDICYTAGFENIAHFSRLFKSQFGYCPSSVRQNMSSASS
jgi:AraC-like DNA-binding protein